MQLTTRHLIFLTALLVGRDAHAQTLPAHLKAAAGPCPEDEKAELFIGQDDTATYRNEKRVFYDGQKTVVLIDVTEYTPARPEKSSKTIEKRRFACIQSQWIRFETQRSVTTELRDGSRSDNAEIEITPLEADGTLRSDLRSVENSELTFDNDGAGAYRCEFLGDYSVGGPNGRTYRAQEWKRGQVKARKDGNGSYWERFLSKGEVSDELADPNVTSYFEVRGGDPSDPTDKAVHTVLGSYLRLFGPRIAGKILGDGDAAPPNLNASWDAPGAHVEHDFTKVFYRFFTNANTLGVIEISEGPRDTPQHRSTCAPSPSSYFPGRGLA